MKTKQPPFPPQTLTPAQVRALPGHLRSWRSLFRFLQKATEGELRAALNVESANHARPQMMRRIITRLGTIERDRLYKLLNIKTK